ncbi:MAG: FkbM family methyltransferase [Oscillospiraceae bacterium]|nr:FkbM family methyltransferase [Oscillospiraceae bacterium]
MEKLFPREGRSVWGRIARADKPVVLYGMGNGADMALDILEEMGVPCAGVFASDGFVRGQSFRGFPVRTLAQTEQLWEDFLIVQCFAVHDRPTLEHIQKLSTRHELVFPDMPVAGEELFTPRYCHIHGGELEQAFSLMSDELSRRTFRDVLDFKLSGDIRYLFACESPREELYSLLQLGGGEHYVDCGAYSGDTLEEFFRVCGERFGSAAALEPDPKNFAKLLRRAGALGLSGEFFCPCGVWDADGEHAFAGRGGRSAAFSGVVGTRRGRSGQTVPVRALDSLLAGRPVTFLKMDVEGCELRALRGARELIRTQAPKLLISAYHRSEDLFALPLYLHDLQPDYRFYLRHQPYLPAWETVLLAIPEEGCPLEA